MEDKYIEGDLCQECKSERALFHFTMFLDSEIKTYGIHKLRKNFCSRYPPKDKFMCESCLIAFSFINDVEQFFEYKY